MEGHQFRNRPMKGSMFVNNSNDATRPIERDGYSASAVKSGTALIYIIFFAGTFTNGWATWILRILAIPCLQRVLANVCENPSLGFPRDLADGPRASIDRVDAIDYMLSNDLLQNRVVLGLMNQSVHRADRTVN